MTAPLDTDIASRIRSGDTGRPAGDPLSPGRGAPLPPGGRPAVHEQVAALARSRPAHTAVRSGREAISYAELDAWAARIAGRLAAAGVGRGSRVGVLAEPSTAMVAAVLGVMRSGAAYLPVDPSNPDRRIAAVLADAGAAAVVATEETAPRAGRTGVPVVPAEHRDGPGSRNPSHRNPRAAAARDGGRPGTAEAAAGDGDSGEGALPAAPPPVRVTGDDPAYLIYTSGSTGEPKGVVVEHRQLASSTLARRLVYPGEPVFLLVSPLAFDSSVAGLWGTLTAGGTLVVAGADEVRDPARLTELVGRHGVTRLLCVPSLYGVLLDAAERAGLDRLRSLETVIVAGEPLPQALIDRHFALHPDGVALVNEYGPTEATVWASYRRYDTPGPVSVGRPVPGTRLYVLDDALRPVPPGERGELFIGGAGVARGYHGRAADTAAAFLDDPFEGREGARMYRTGDLARWNADGTLAFLGRRDHQVKIRGHRVELGAVEIALCSLTGVREAVVVPNRTSTGLAAFVIAPSAPDAAALREQLADRLPPAMVPARITVLGDFPRTVNGKADRARLRERADEADAAPAPAREQAPAPAQGSGSADDLTARISAAWAEVLGVREVPTEVNFFDMGGHSLAMFRLQDALERHTGHRPAVVALFRHTTVSEQRALIRDGGGAGGAGSDTGRASTRRADALRARRQRAQQGVAK
ncbi:non-ribosomal peptide synthetase [Streptomyces sp. Ru87]|uniref:non-ribosomal peptide synthetase n=1 Tax=Streptomyces sp. Ru87 TaxID=2044307 RepID=UPI000BF2791B|nr:non-ribosomal peptide synthetase [Streptomyces sp. Ru87]PGH46872.1 amino acid adenylation protein [Streptomyces sp. Ru87]